MRIIQSSIGKFHHFDLARQLDRHGCLTAIFTGYPLQKLTREKLPGGKVHSFPWIHTPFMFLGRYIYGTPFHKEIGWLGAMTFDSYVSRNSLLSQCDVFVGLSGAALHSGRRVQRAGGKYICDRGSSHILFQDRILREEHARWGIPFVGIDRRVIDREEAEYEAADMITVPSGFAERTFREQGIHPEKLRCIPYGVDLSRFEPVTEPDEDTFEIIFVGGVGVRKGIPYLLEAFARLKHPRKRLKLIGGISAEARALIARFPLDAVTIQGHCPQHQLKELMSRAHVLVLPSIEDGFGLVQAQAMACGCTVIASTNTGAADLFTHGVEGLIIPPGSTESLLDALTSLAEDPVRLATMRAAALSRVRLIQGWSEYGTGFVQLCKEFTGESPQLNAVHPVG
jgi:glycosyltransferase involved in cell wall biosynthesis